MTRFARILAVLTLLVFASQASAYSYMFLTRTAEEQLVNADEYNGRGMYVLTFNFNEDGLITVYIGGAGGFNLYSSQRMAIDYRSILAGRGGQHSRHFTNVGSNAIIYLQLTGSTFYMSVICDRFLGTTVDYIKVDSMRGIAEWVTRAEAKAAGLLTARLSVSGPAAGLPERRGKPTLGQSEEQPTSWGAIKQEDK